MTVLKYGAVSLRRSTIPLGRQNDNGVLAVRVDVSGWLADYPGGVIAGYCTQPGRTEAYPVAIVMDGTDAVWNVSGGDTAKSGYGEFQIAMLGADGEKLHSAIAQTHIEKSLTASGEAPEAIKPWMDQVTQDVSGGVRFDKPQSLTDEQKKQARDNIGVGAGGGGGVDEDAVKEIVEEALEEAQASGEFDGPEGPQGPPGASGVYIGPEEPTDPTVSVWIDSDGEPDGLPEEMVQKLGFDPTKQGLPIMYMWGDTTGEDKDNEVTLTYRFGEHSGTLKRKWQGSGSVGLGKELGAILGDENNGKMNYTIKVDTPFEAKKGWGEQRKYCLKANVADFSHARNLGATTIWGQACACRANRSLKLYKSPNWGAVDGFPILLIVNDEYRGLYTFNIPKDGWMMGMGDGEREAIVCAEVGADFSTPITMGQHFKLEYASDEDNAEWVKESLDAIVTAINTGNWPALEAAMDIDSAIDYMLTVAKCTGGDAMTRNYLLHTYDGVRWAFTVYDADTWFGIEWGGDGHISANAVPTIMSTTDANLLFRMIAAYAPDRVAKRYWELRKKVLSASNIAETLLDFVARIPKAVYDAEVSRWPGIKATATNNALQMVDHIRARETIIDAEAERIDAPMLKPKATWYNADLAGVAMNTLTEIHFDADYAVTGSEEASWDCSRGANGSIMAYRTGTVVTVKPTAHNYVKLHIDSTEMFAGCKQLAKITGTEMFTAGIKTVMQSACYDCNKLNTPIYIPDGVINTIRMFGNTWVLRKTYDIPGTVFYMNGMFSGGGLFEAPEIPGSVLEMSEAFTGCPITRLPPTIPESVLAINYAFKACYKASGLIEIRCKNITNYTEAFNLAARDTDGIVLVGPNTQLAEIAATNTDGKVTVG